MADLPQHIDDHGLPFWLRHVFVQVIGGILAVGGAVTPFVGGSPWAVGVIPYGIRLVLRPAGPYYPTRETLQVWFNRRRPPKPPELPS